MKNKNVCICIRAILTLAEKNRFVVDAIKPKINTWAPWMLKFSYQLMNKYIQEYDTLSALYPSNTSTSSISDSGSSSYLDALNTNVDTNTKIEKGPYLIIYGENDDERELTWKDRSERTFQYLHASITRMGSNPELLLPDDSFVIDGPVPLLEDIPNRPAVSIDSTVGSSGGGCNTTLYNDSAGIATATPILEFRDGMTDEELDAYLAQSNQLD
jgi:hypothetical protein